MEKSIKSIFCRHKWVIRNDKKDLEDLAKEYPGSTFYSTIRYSGKDYLYCTKCESTKRL